MSAYYKVYNTATNTPWPILTGTPVHPLAHAILQISQPFMSTQWRMVRLVCVDRKAMVTQINMITYHSEEKKKKKGILEA